MKRLIIGLVGRKGSGKGTVAKILKEKYGASVYRFSDVLREILDLLFVEKSRENLVQLSEILRNEFGQDVLKLALLQKIRNDTSALIVMDGLRRLGDLEGLKDISNFQLVCVSVPPGIRYERLKARGENAGETTRTFESFMELEKAPTEVTIGPVEELADITLDNSGTPDELERKVEEMMDGR
ncbi:MAG: AAA family ATPase [Patescibacteria group bacterium]